MFNVFVVLLSDNFASKIVMGCVNKGWDVSALDNDPENLFCGKLTKMLVLSIDTDDYLSCEDIHEEIETMLKDFGINYLHIIVAAGCEIAYSGAEEPDKELLQE